MPLPKSHRKLEPRACCANCQHFGAFSRCRKNVAKDASGHLVYADDIKRIIHEPQDETCDEHEAGDA